KLAFKTGGYRTLRRIVSRFARSQDEDYGRGPAGRVLPAIRASQIMMQDRVLGTEMAVKPPLLAPSDDLDQAVIDLGPFGITYGGLDDMGREQLKPFLTSIGLADAAQLHAEIHATIDKA
ncbi:portal protein, partial [Serratia marcescens]|uniref:portal protein n=1 Tax=Serratia marcescens TaxID=615 RepID=UPI002813CB4B